MKLKQQLEKVAGWVFVEIKQNFKLLTNGKVCDLWKRIEHGDESITGLLNKTMGCIGWSKGSIVLNVYDR